MYPIVRIFNFEMSSSWFMLIVGILSMIVINLIRSRKHKINWIISIVISLVVNIFAILGAKVLYTIENFQDVIENGISLGGFSFFGTVFLLPLALLPVGRIFRMRTSDFIDFCTPAVAFELAVYRMGCFMGGCCYGIPASWGIAMDFDPNTLRIPVQLFEVIFDLGIFVFLLIFIKRTSIKGLLYPLFMITYGFVRFILEFVRVTPKNIIGFSLGQILSMLSIGIGLFLVYRIINTQKV